MSRLCFCVCMSVFFVCWQQEMGGVPALQKQCLWHNFELHPGGFFVQVLHHTDAPRTSTLSIPKQ